MKSRTLTMLLILLIAVSYSFFIKPHREKLVAARTTTTELQTTLDTLTRNQIEVSDNIDISDLDSILIQQAIPEGFDQDNLINDLKAIADEHLVNLVNISFNQTYAEQSQQIKAIQINLNANGSPSSLKAFIAELENANRSYNLKTMNLNFGNINDVDLATATLSLEAYFS